MLRTFCRLNLIRDAADWWRALIFDCGQRTNVRRRRFVPWHNLEVFRLPQSERDVLYVRVADEWTCYKTARGLAVQTSVVCVVIDGAWMKGTVHERRIIRRIVKVEYNVQSRGALSQLVRYSAMRRLSYERMMVRCHG